MAEFGRRWRCEEGDDEEEAGVKNEEEGPLSLFIRKYKYGMRKNQGGGMMMLVMQVPQYWKCSLR